MIASLGLNSLPQLLALYLFVLFAKAPCLFLPWFCSSEQHIPGGQFDYAFPEGKIVPSCANLRSVYRAVFLQQNHVQNRKNQVCNKPKKNL